VKGRKCNSYKAFTDIILIGVSFASIWEVLNI